MKLIHKKCNKEINEILVFQKDLCVRIDYRVSQDGLIEDDYEIFSGHIEQVTFKCPECGWQKIKREFVDNLDDFLFYGTNLLPVTRFTKNEYGSIIIRK